MIDGQQNISIPNVFLNAEDKFPWAFELIMLLVDSWNKVRLQKLVKEQLKTDVDQVHARGHHLLWKRDINQPAQALMLQVFYVYPKLRYGNYT